MHTEGRMFARQVCSAITGWMGVQHDVDELSQTVMSQTRQQDKQYLRWNSCLPQELDHLPIAFD